MKGKNSTPKMSGLVVAALRNLRDAHGSTAKEIMKYIMAEYNASEATVQRQLKTALKRGVEYGILKKTNAGYSLNTDAEVIGPLDLAQMDQCGCKPRRRGCAPRRRRHMRRRSSRKRRSRRMSCPRRRKRNACPPSGVTSMVRYGRDGTPFLNEKDMKGSEDMEKDSINEENEQDRNYSRGSSRTKAAKSRSPSVAKNSGSEDEDDRDD